MLTVLKFLTSTLNLPSQASSLPLGFNTKDNPEKQLKETRRTRGQEPTLPSYSPNSEDCEALNSTIQQSSRLAEMKSDMEKYCPQQGLPERGVIIFVVEALSQSQKVLVNMVAV